MRENCEWKNGRQAPDHIEKRFLRRPSFDPVNIGKKKAFLWIDPAPGWLELDVHWRLGKTP
jgi:hypothetical protein